MIIFYKAYNRKAGIKKWLRYLTSYENWEEFNKMENQLVWKEQYCIGVPNIDKAHKRLFSIVGRLMRLVEEDEKDEHACVEGIKYFKNYAIKHFAEEEEYMRSINYEGYETHKRLHEGLRDKTLPALEQNMERSFYSDESVCQFLGVCMSWLTGHIMVEDRAIVGKVTSRWSGEQDGSVNETLERGLADIIKRVFSIKARVFNNHYAGENTVKAVNHRLDYLTPEGNRLRIIISVEEQLIVNTMRRYMGVECTRINNTAVAMARQMDKQVLRLLKDYFPETEGIYRLQEEALISTRGMKSLFAVRCPQYSLLLDTGMGYFTFCADELGANKR